MSGKLETGPMIGTVEVRIIKRRVNEKKPYSDIKTLHECYLEEGMDEIWNLVCGYGSAVAYNNTDARIGVGNSSTAEDETQTGLIGGSTNFQGMKTGYPKTPGADAMAQKAVFRSVFADGQAEFAWEEFTIDNGNTRNKNLVRIVASKGTKSAGEEWEVEITTPVQNPA